VTGGLAMPPGWTVGDVDEWIQYHGENSKPMITQRTSLESKLIPVSAYILIGSVECYWRYPELMAAIDAAMPAEKIGARGRRPGTQVNAVNLWSIANVFLHGRQILILLGQIPSDHEPERSAAVLDFWRRAAPNYHGGHLAAWETKGPSLTPYEPDVIAALYDATAPVDDETGAVMKRLNALLMSYLFLLYFDTRAGIGDTGPYPLADGRVLLVRDFSKLGVSDFAWSHDVAQDVPYRNLTAAFVLNGVDLTVNDWGTSTTRPEDYLDRVERFGLFTTDDGNVAPVPLAEMPAISAAVKQAQAKQYRLIAAMSRRERLNAGAYVYFTFLRPFADVAGVADALDWSLPNASLPVYEWLEPFEGTNEPPDPSLPYYMPLGGYAL